MGDIVRKAKGGKFIGWYVRYKDADGRRKIRASHQPSKEAARRYLVEVEARIARGQVGVPAPVAPPPTIAQLISRFLTEYSRPRIKNLTVYRVNGRSCLRRVIPLVGSKPADALQTEDIERMRDILASKHAAGSVRLSLAYLSTMYSWAIKLGIVTRNPVRGVERPAMHSSIDFYSREEVASLLRVAAQRAAAGGPANKLLACCVHLALHSGLRKGELLGLRWQDLDFDTQRLTVARSFKTVPKSGKARHLRLPSECVPVLRQWRNVCPVTPEGLVFPVHHKTVDQWTPELLQAAGCRVPAHPWHTMRHTFASHFIMAGGNILTLQKILGHADVKMTLVYAHLAPDFLGQEMERVKY
jgi:integrase